MSVCERCKRLEAQIDALTHALQELRLEAGKIQLHIETYVIDYLRKLAGERRP